MDGSDAAFDWKHPDYGPIYLRRYRALERLRSNPRDLALLKGFYRDHPAQFISDWGVTFDPRNVEVGLPAVVPFVLYPKQVAWVEYVIRKWLSRTSGLTEKSRECGVSWLAISLACTLCVFYEGVSIGFGSRKQEYVDKLGEPKSILEKGRIFMDAIPPEFRAGWVRQLHAPLMRFKFPETGSSIGGEGGDDIGRGDRRSIYIVDEAAHLEHPEKADAALAMTTNCRIDVSSVNGSANSFAKRRFSGKIEVFTFHWRDDPRKDDEWYAKKSAELVDPVIVAQELDIDYNASTEGSLIPSKWIQSAIDAHVKLKFAPSGDKFAGFDVADEGPDTCAFAGAHGVVLEVLEQWSGKGGDIFASVARAMLLCDEHGYRRLRYDADGLGASVRGDGRVLNKRRRNAGGHEIDVFGFRGSDGVLDPERYDIPGRKNVDYYQNFKAQSWMSLRMRFLKTHRAVTEQVSYGAEELISISSKLALLPKLSIELSQPRWRTNGAGKIVIDKIGDDATSPNLADGVNIRFAPMKRKMRIGDDVLENARRL